MAEYKRQWGSTHPGCLIILLDQSGSMDDKFGPGVPGSGSSKADMVARVLNNLLRELVAMNTVGVEVKPRADVAVLGYSGSQVKNALGGILSKQDFSNLQELMSNPLRKDSVMKTDVDEAGNIIKVPEDVLVWVDAVASGGTPMCAALSEARGLAKRWVYSGNHMTDCYPPVVINITDGMSTDGDPAGPAQALFSVRTDDGPALLFNCHITDQNASPIEFPVSESELQLPPETQKFASQLFNISSELPESSLKSMPPGQAPPLGARGFVFNGQLTAIRQMFVFATLPGQGAVDPNR